MIHFIDAMDMIGRVHMLGATPVDLNNPREVDQRSALSRGMQATLKRWFNDLPPQIRSADADLTSAIVLTVSSRGKQAGESSPSLIHHFANGLAFLLSSVSGNSSIN
jgi:hypothetical protein